MRASRAAGAVFAALTLPLGSSCSGRQSALSPAGDEAQSVLTLLIVMTIGAIVIWFVVIGLLVHAMRHKREIKGQGVSQALILWGGAIVPSVVLLALLSFALWLMPSVRPWLGDTEKGPTVEVTGEQFWWRVRYLDAEGQLLFETANEVRLPVDAPTRFSLLAHDVIHSFWIPSLGGKMDMIPGRVNQLALTPRRTGIYRGPCAEFCGTSHALMAFNAVVMEQEAYDDWVAARVAESPPVEHAGAALFVRHGCTACHAVKGTQARGRIGPDLTALAEREAIGAGTLQNTPDNIARFIRDPAAIKPGVKMPAYDMLADADIKAIAAWLGGAQ